MDDRVWVVLLIGGAAGLPIIGFGRLLSRTQRKLNEELRTVRERGHDGFSYDDLERPGSSILDEPRGERNAVVWDICLVGTGLVAGAVASVWSLFPTW